MQETQEMQEMQVLAAHQPNSRISRPRGARETFFGLFGCLFLAVFADEQLQLRLELGHPWTPTDTLGQPRTPLDRAAPTRFSPSPERCQSLAWALLWTNHSLQGLGQEPFQAIHLDHHAPHSNHYSLWINMNWWIVTPTTDVFGFEAIDLDLGPGVAAAAPY